MRNVRHCFVVWEASKTPHVWEGHRRPLRRSCGETEEKLMNLRRELHYIYIYIYIYSRLRYKPRESLELMRWNQYQPVVEIVSLGCLNKLQSLNVAYLFSHLGCLVWRNT